MVEDMVSAYGSRLVIAVVGVGVGFVLLIAAFWFIRRRNGPSPFVRGGKNRQPRLQVLDAAAVDTRRRLVLVRRDNVEHLIMIGGPTDIVIESGIGAMAAVTMPQSATRISPSEPIAAQAPDTPAASRLAVPAEMRAIPVQRTVPAESRIEPARDAPRPAPTTPPTVAPAASAEPASRPTAAVEPASAPVVELPAPPAPPVKAESMRPIAALAAANVASKSPESGPARAAENKPAQSAENAVDLLEAARSRVFQETPEPRIVPVEQAKLPSGLQHAAENPRQLGSDFERILEQEMANNLAAREVPAAANRQLPQRDPAAPRLTGATPEPSLQSEVARIFGEMSVGRDK